MGSCMKDRTDTPRTDAAVMILKTLDEWTGKYDEGLRFVDPEFARGLERELIATTERMNLLNVERKILDSQNGQIDAQAENLAHAVVAGIGIGPGPKSK